MLRSTVRMPSAAVKLEAGTVSAVNAACSEQIAFLTFCSARLTSWAAFTIGDLADPTIDVSLTPEGRDTWTWSGLPVTDRGFEARESESEHIRGKFFGAAAEEVGGFVKRDRLLGTHGATW